MHVHVSNLLIIIILIFFFFLRLVTFRKGVTDSPYHPYAFEPNSRPIYERRIMISGGINADGKNISGQVWNEHLKCDVLLPDFYGIRRNENNNCEAAQIGINGSNNNNNIDDTSQVDMSVLTEDSIACWKGVEDGEGLLHVACRHGRIRGVQLLVDSQIDINVR